MFGDYVRARARARKSGEPVKPGGGSEEIASEYHSVAYTFFGMKTVYYLI